MKSDNFVLRHIGPRPEEVTSMLKKVGANSIDALIDEIIPSGIRLKKQLDLTPALSEYQYSKHVNKLAAKNKLYKSYIGLGYNDTITPSVIKRNILENPGWYTAYTPYQAEISQGRMEALLTFQTMVLDLTGMEIANASLLDESTAAAEAMIMLYNSRSKESVKNEANLFFVSEDCFPQTIDVLKTRSTPLGIELVIGGNDLELMEGKFFGALLQYPTAKGEVHNYKNFVENAHSKDIKVAVAADLMSLLLLTPPGEWGADVVVGSSQRFGVPMGYGGPHAAFFATKEEYKRQIPGRIIGVSIDAQGNRALRMALQTREQHIKRDKATSNICTAQALLAIMASMYAVYHGPKGLKEIATQIHLSTKALANELKKLAYSVSSENTFDTICIELPSDFNLSALQKIALENEINFNYSFPGFITISINETTEAEDINVIIGVFAQAANKQASSVTSDSIIAHKTSLDVSLIRKSNYLTHPVFSSYHSESEMMRYIKKLENRDLSLTHSMISLGSCTMKLNAASELYPISIPEFGGVHPFVPIDQALGYKEMIDELERSLCEITGFAAMSFQPNSGAQGEYAGLMAIREYHISRGDSNRNIALIPSSAHGTNPASAAMAGMKIIVTKCDENGNIDIEDIRTKAIQNKDNLSCLMVTYPSTHGVYEEGITTITNIIHENGGLVYMDGANMNAQVGLTNPGNIGADVCHLNLHKTFAIPHGGGGPGVGPIGVNEKLKPFLPTHPLMKTGGEKGIHAVSSAPYGSALILLISYGYIKMLGTEGLTSSTKFAILNANYIKSSLEKHFPVLYQGKNSRVAHEMILDCRNFKKDSGIEAGDISKRLMDYGFHAPTVSFPVAGTLMVEPTESESLQELDHFCETMISIRKEIDEIAQGLEDKSNNVIKNAPHTAKVVVSDNWNKPYSREKAAYPLARLKDNKFWPSVSLIDNAYGDRNLICSCPSIESYEDALA